MSPLRFSVGVLILAAASLTAATEPVWRPFSDDSMWNQRIAKDAAPDVASGVLIADFAARGPLKVNITDWSIPLYFVDSAVTPKCDVRDSRPGVYGAGFGFPRQIPIPDDAVASPPVAEDSDNHLCIVDRTRELSWDMWLARRDPDGRWSTGLGAVVDLRGTGVAVPWFEAKREFDSHRSRAGGFPLIAGLIRLEEIKAGCIEHALAFAYDHCRTELFVPPASTAQANNLDAVNSRGIPMGGRIQLDPAWDVEHSNLSRAGKIVARALQDYGAFCSDYAGGNVLYAENSPAAVRAWTGLLDERELESVFTPEMIRSHFRVVDMGNLLPGQNLEIPPPYVVGFAVDGASHRPRIDQLTRTITVPVSTRTGNRLSTAHWALYLRGTRVAVAGQPVTGTSAAIDLSEPEVLQLTAPDGRKATWRIVATSDESGISAHP